MRERLVVFLYILMRDALPTGTVEEIMRDHVETIPQELPPNLKPAYSSPHLEAYARELAERLR